MFLILRNLDKINFFYCRDGKKNLYLSANISTLDGVKKSYDFIREKRLQNKILKVMGKKEFFLADIPEGEMKIF